MGLFTRDPAKRAQRKIARHMKKNGIRQSDGLVVGKDGKVYYDRNQDERTNPSSPNGTPPFMPEDPVPND